MIVGLMGGSEMCDDLVVCINMVMLWVLKRLAVLRGCVCIRTVVMYVQMWLDKLSGCVLLVKG